MMSMNNRYSLPHYKFPTRKWYKTVLSVHLLLKVGVLLLHYLLFFYYVHMTIVWHRVLNSIERQQLWINLMLIPLEFHLCVYISLYMYIINY